MKFKAHLSFQSSSALKFLAKQRLGGNWKSPVMATLLAGVVMLGATMVATLLQLVLENLLGAIFEMVINYLVIPPITLGLTSYYLNFTRGDNPSSTDIFKGYDHFWKSVVAIFQIGIFSLLWSLLLFIPGVIKGYSYSMTLFILSDNPQLSVSQAINKSKEMMKGHKWELFLLHLSFIGWVILSTITLFIGFLWLTPYMMTSMCYFYENLKGNNPKMLFNNGSYNTASGPAYTVKSQDLVDEQVKSLTKKIDLSNLSNITISRRDFILLGILMLLLEGYVLYSFLLMPKWQQFSTQQTHYKNQKTLAINLEKDNANKSKIQEELKLLDYRLGKLTLAVPPNVAQEEIVLALNKLSNDRKLKIDSLSLSDISSASKEDFATGKIPAAQAKNAGDGKSPAKAIPVKVGGTVLTEDISIGFSGSYGALYNFMSDLEKGNRKIITQEVTMVRGNENLLKGEFKVQYVGYKGPEDTGSYKLETPAVSGKSSPFLAYQGYDGKGAGSPATEAGAPVASANTPAAVKTYDPNFYLILNSYDDNAPKVIMGDYTKAGTELYGNSNNQIKGKISINGNLDKMTYTYAIGSSTQTKDAKLMMDGGKLRLDVISQQRKNATDKVGITLDIDNRTDYPFEINVINDDKNAPRFSIGNKSGIVVVK